MNLTHRSTLSLSALRSLVLVGLVAGAAGACSEATAPSPTLPAGTIAVIPNMRAEDISADGKTVLLTDLTSPTADFYFYDVASGTNTLKGSAGDALFDFVTGISNGQRVSAVHGKPENAALWDQANGWLDLGGVYANGCVFDTDTGAQDLSSGWDIDSAGHTAVGLVWNGCNAEAFLWSDASGAGAFVPMDLIGDGDSTSGNPASNRATVISDNGNIAGGFASQYANVGGYTYWIDRRPAMWTSNGLGSMIPSGGVYTDDCPGEVLAISADGGRVAGIWCQKAFTWSAAGGTIDLSGDGLGYGQAVALNGQLVFGSNAASFFDPYEPFVWTQAGGVKSLTDIATANGITLPAGYYWGAVVAASADGSVVVGTMYDDTYQTSTVVLQIPVSAYGL